MHMLCPVWLNFGISVIYAADAPSEASIIQFLNSQQLYAACVCAARVCVSMQTCARLEGEAVDLLAVHALRPAHARRQLEAEVAQQLRHAGVVHDPGQRLPNALPRPCTNEERETHHASASHLVVVVLITCLDNL